MKNFTLFALLLPLFGFTQGNPAFTEANIEAVYNQFNLTGDGVIFASIERGIDYTHPAFINPDGTTKIAYIYDMIDSSGASNPNNPYGIGTIYTEADINASLMAGGTPLTTDRHGHGTACTGIVAGNGAGTTNGEFHGVAVDAKIISVRFTLDAFPPFGSEPAQSGFYNPAYLPVALEFVHDKVTELGHPSVTLINLGSIGGPTDGTSTISQAMEDFINQGHILVCGVGDDGGGDNHAQGTVNQNETIELEINKTVAGNLRFELWYSENDRFDVTVEVPGGTQYGPYAAPTNANGAVDQFPGTFNFYHRGANQEFYGASSNRRNIFIDFFGGNGLYKVILNGATITDGSFHATLNPATHYSANGFQTYAVPGTSINDFASTQQVIVPTDYVSNNTWTDINGIPRSRPAGEGDPGEIWVGSSEGPTQDGRQGVDFASPGEVIFAPYSPNTWYSNFAFNMVQGGNSLYGIQTAVSAAAPLACGVIALMLELDPTLTNQEVKDILSQTAREDSFTGTVPNTTWGSGKLDALAAIQEVNNQLSIADFASRSGIKVYPNPTKEIINFESTLPISKLTVYSMDGKEIFAKEGNVESLNISKYNSGLYLLEIVSNEKTTFHRIIKN
ncbi:MAG: S8 family peptidase [Flavobacteriaceae bacterium]